MASETHPNYHSRILLDLSVAVFLNVSASAMCSFEEEHELGSSNNKAFTFLRHNCLNFRE